MVQLCIFDLDGTLANTLDSIAGFANEALRRCGWNPILPKEEYRFLVGNGADCLMRRMLSRTAGTYTEEDVVRLRSVYDDLYGADPMREVKEYPGLFSVLQTLKSHGIRLAVLSNKPDRDARAVISHLFPEGFFDRCYGQREEIPRKPAPDGALLIAKELGVPPQNCLYIGDSGVDMETGRAAGMKTVGVLWGFRDREELMEHDADALAKAPEDLLLLAETEKPQ